MLSQLKIAFIGTINLGSYLQSHWSNKGQICDQVVNGWPGLTYNTHLLSCFLTFLHTVLIQELHFNHFNTLWKDVQPKLIQRSYRIVKEAADRCRVTPGFAKTLRKHPQPEFAQHTFPPFQEVETAKEKLEVLLGSEIDKSVGESAF